MKKKISWFLENFEEIFSSCFLVIMVTTLFVQVVFRYLFNESIPWTEELSRIAFLFMVFFAASYATKNSSHVRVTAQFKPFPPIVKTIFLIFGDVVWMLFSCIVIYTGFKLFASMGEHALISPVLGWNLKWVFVMIPIGFVLQLYRLLQRDIKTIRDLIKERGVDNAS